MKGAKSVVVVFKTHKNTKPLYCDHAKNPSVQWFCDVPAFKECHASKWNYTGGSEAFAPLSKNVW